MWGIHKTRCCLVAICQPSLKDQLDRLQHLITVNLMIFCLLLCLLNNSNSHKLLIISISNFVLLDNDQQFSLHPRFFHPVHVFIWSAITAVLFFEGL